MAYYAGDIPAEDLIIEPERNGQLIDLTPFNGAEITLRSFDGTEVETAGFITSIIDDRLVIEWPEDGAFTSAGLFTLQITLTNTATTVRERVAPYQYIVQGDDGWHSLDTAREQWENAPENDLKLYSILWAARQEITAYAPPLDADTRPPVNYIQAQVMQARNIWNAAKVDPASGGLGEDSFIIRPFPLDWMIVQILRPKTAIPRVG
jgi:hypothetical protein